MSDILQRAFAAYFRAASKESGDLVQPNLQTSAEEEHGGRKYVVLRNVSGVLAVYRVKTDGFLKRLDRWPKTVK